ncbi:MAG TPA: hypothetical protein VGE59_03880 [Patescibacteria group bacterium]
MVLLQSAPSWDLVITLVFVIGVSYGFIMLRDRILVTLLSLYAGMMIATTLAEPIHKFFNGDIALLNKIWVESSASPFLIKLFLFGGTVLLLGAKSGLGGRRSNFSFMELATYSFLNVCIALTAVFSFMEPDVLQGYINASKLVATVVQHQNLWLIAPLVVMLVLGGSAGGRRHPDDY